MEFKQEVSESRVTETDHAKFLVSAILDCLRPYIQADGGGIELISLDDGIVSLKMTGACVGCPASYYTQTLVIEKEIKEKIPHIKQVLFID